ncbi:hypothetical protein VWX35_00125 [Phaeobacter sp. A36a-5a]|uniref:COG4223 family protein n=1 Tax=Phaeobacter bryozoorum TaxID=1086632 RepID=UPI0030C8E08C
MADKKTSDEMRAERGQTSVSKLDIDETAAGDDPSELVEATQAEDSKSEVDSEAEDVQPSEPVNAETGAVSDDQRDQLDPQQAETAELAEASTVETAATERSADDLPPFTPPAPEVERIVERRGGFGAAVLGGVVAAGLGFVAGQSNVLDGFLPPSWRSAPSVDATALEELQERLNTRISELEDRIAATADDLNLAPLAEQLDTLKQEVAALQSGATAAGDTGLADALDSLAIRVDALESRPITDAASPEAVAAFEAELNKLQDSLAAQRAEVEKMVDEARAMDAASAEAARIASAQTIVARLRSALDAGTSFSGLLDELRAVGVTPPEALAGSAEAGVSTRSSLRDGFAPAAREALAAARQEAKGTGGIAAYMRRQLGARSVAPREGDDPDAVLSRAEAAVQNGNLQDALMELEALPETALAPLADWQAAARARLSAVAAVNELAQSLNAK